jgi:peptidoglycan/LPS O-acetylase OafA/YrhL
MRYLPQLDGLRGCCVAAVFLFHSQFLDCGWVGVQAFFVLSGFLITGVLLDARARDEPARTFFRNFYVRRVLRIVPVYLAYIGVVVAAGLLGVGGAEMASSIRAHNAEHLPYLLTFTYNFFHLVSGPGSPFYGHLWTLSIEEQFYLLWPLCVFLLARGRLANLCKLLVVAGPLIRLAEVWLAQRNGGVWGAPANFVYFLTSSHLDAFALGALLNFRDTDSLVGKVASWPARRILLPLALLSAVLLLAAKRAHLGPSLSAFGWPLYIPHFQAPVWGYSLLNLGAFAVIARAAHLRLLQGRALQRLGKVSYGFYIFHLPVIWLAAMLTDTDRGSFGAFNLMVQGLAFVATWLLAEFSFRFLESPLLRLKVNFGGAPRPRESHGPAA